MGNFSETEGGKEALPESRQSFEVALARTFGLVNLVFSRQTGFFECEHSFKDKPMVTTEPAVPGARTLGLGSKLYPINMPGVFNKDLTGFKQSLSLVNKIQRAKECQRKAQPCWLSEERLTSIIDIQCLKQWFRCFQRGVRQGFVETFFSNKPISSNKTKSLWNKSELHHY